MSFSGGKGEAINLLYQLIICRVTVTLWAPRDDGTWVPVRHWQTKLCGFLACSTIHGVPNDLGQGAGKQTWATEMSTGEVSTARFQKWWECGSSLPQAMSFTAGLGTRSFSGLSLGNLKRLYLLFHKLLFPNFTIHKCYY